jgi:uncharacterized protein
MHRFLPRRLPGLFAALLLVLMAGCERGDTGPEIKADQPDPLATPQTLRLGEVTLTAELAIHRSEQATGLMHRESLPPDHGMLFLYESPQRVSFWMKDTLLPLDIGFFASDGELLEIKRMYPRDRTSVPSTSDRVQFALEMEQGWFRGKSLVPGARLDLDSLRVAIANRGVDPARYGL